MNSLFKPIRLGDLELPNRIVMAPLTRARAGEARLLRDELALNAPDFTTFYGGDAKGYVDYPAREVSAEEVRA